MATSEKATPVAPATPTVDVPNVDITTVVNTYLDTLNLNTLDRATLEDKLIEQARNQTTSRERLLEHASAIILYLSDCTAGLLEDAFKRTRSDTRNAELRHLAQSVHDTVFKGTPVLRRSGHVVAHRFASLLSVPEEPSTATPRTSDTV